MLKPEIQLNNVQAILSKISNQINPFSEKAINHLCPKTYLPIVRAVDRKEIKIPAKLMSLKTKDNLTRIREEACQESLYSSAPQIEA